MSAKTTEERNLIPAPEKLHLLDVLHHQLIAKIIQLIAKTTEWPNIIEKNNRSISKYKIKDHTGYLLFISIDLSLNCSFEKQLCHKPSGFLVIVRLAHPTKAWTNFFRFTIFCMTHMLKLLRSYVLATLISHVLITSWNQTLTVALTMISLFEKLLTNVRIIPSK